MVKLGNNTKRLLREAKEDQCGSTSVGGSRSNGRAKKRARRWFREDIKVVGEGSFPLYMLMYFTYFPKDKLSVNALTMLTHRVVNLCRVTNLYSEDGNKSEDKAWKIAGWEVFERKAEEL